MIAVVREMACGAAADWPRAGPAGTGRRLRRRRLQPSGEDFTAREARENGAPGRTRISNPRFVVRGAAFPKESTRCPGELV